jgi:hypothetical protein
MNGVGHLCYTLRDGTEIPSYSYIPPQDVAIFRVEEFTLGESNLHSEPVSSSKKKTKKSKTSKGSGKSKGPKDEKTGGKSKKPAQPKVDFFALSKEEQVDSFIGLKNFIREDPEDQLNQVMAAISSRIATRFPLGDLDPTPEWTAVTEEHKIKDISDVKDFLLALSEKEIKMICVSQRLFRTTKWEENI